MADAYILNAIPAGYGASMSLIVEMLVSAGWTYKASGDGLAGYNATGKVFTGSQSGALGWNNSRAWARLADPGNGREVCIQHGANATIRLKYSRAGKFVGGTPSATTVPSATDERVLWGAGTDASPTMNNWFGATGAPKFHGFASAAAPYGFWISSNITPAGAIQCGVMMDPVTGVPEDIDPVVWHIGSTGAFITPGWGGPAAVHSSGVYTSPGGTNQGCYGHRDAAATAFEAWFPAGYALGQVNAHNIPGVGDFWVMGRAGGSQNTINAKFEAMPVPYIRGAVSGLANPGFKGWSTLSRWPFLARVHAVDTLDTKRWIAIGCLWLPWDGVTDPSN